MPTINQLVRNHVNLKLKNLNHQLLTLVITATKKFKLTYLHHKNVVLQHVLEQ